MYMSATDIAKHAAATMSWPRQTPKIFTAGSELFEFGAVFYDNHAEVFDGDGLLVVKIHKDEFASKGE